MTMKWDSVNITTPKHEMSISLVGLPGPLNATIEKMTSEKLYRVHLGGMPTSDDVLDFSVSKLDIGKRICELYMVDYLHEFSEAEMSLIRLLREVEDGPGLMGTIGLR
jgi:hypothetical protein